MKTDLYNQKGEKIGDIDLPKAYFEAEVNEGLMHEALLMQKANARRATAHAKTRGEVVASTKKIYRQKGTGGARHGARSANIFRGGGKAFGPRPGRNFTMQMPKKMRRKALVSALSARALDKDIIGLDKYDVEVIKTKDFKSMVEKLPESRSYLFVIGGKNEFIEKSARNLPNVKTILVNYLNIADLLKYRKVIFMQEAIDKLPEIFTLNTSKAS